MATPAPKFSVVTISFNHAEFIKANIESVLAQKYPNFEHIIVDGGSTDGTLEILRSYPHLKWTSEPDRGISDALNKGFARATGDVIAWLNSDDWYANGAFSAVAPLIEKHPVIMGAAVQTDRAGVPSQTVPNTERSVFDLQRYWVPMAWLAQPGIFFRRDLLEQTRLAVGTYVDNSLHFAMDYDLWLRMAARVPFNCRIDRVLAYFRVYGENRTGSNHTAQQRELGRVFRKFTSTYLRAERKFSFVLPVKDAGEALKSCFTKIVEQQLTDLEIVVVDLHDNLDRAKATKNFVAQIEEATNIMGVRYLRPKNLSYFPALNEAIAEVSSQFTVLIRPGDVIGADFAVRASNIFSHDPIAAMIPISALSPTAAAAYDPNAAALLVDHLIQIHRFSPCSVFRTVALKELGGFREDCAFPDLPFRDLLLRLFNRGWAIVAAQNLPPDGEALDGPGFAEMAAALNQYSTAWLISEFGQDTRAEPFNQVRISNNATVEIRPEMLNLARQALSSAPPNWQELDYGQSAGTWEALLAKYPNFLAGWIYLQRRYADEGRTAEAEAAAAKYRALTGA